MTTLTANRHFNKVATSRTDAPAKPARASIWSVLSKSLEMAHVVGEFGPVSEHQMARVRSIAAKL